MTTAADVIAALNQKRLLKRGQPDTPGQLPAGWNQWIAEGQSVRCAQRARDRAASWVDTLAQRLSYAQIKPLKLSLPFFHLQRLSRPHDPRQERGLRIGVGVVDLVMHIVLAALVIWLMYLRFLALANAPQDDSSVVQVEFIGRGNAETGGGALANAGATQAPAAASKTPPTPTPTPPAEAQPPQVAQQSQAAQQLIAEAAPELPQELPQVDLSKAAPVLQVTEVKQPQPDSFQLPPPQERTLKLPTVALRDAQPQQQVEQLAATPTLQVRTLQPAEHAIALKAPQLKQQVETLGVFTAKQPAVSKEHGLPTSAAAQLQVPTLKGGVQDLPLAAGSADGQAEAGKGAGAQKTAEVGGRGVTSAGSGAGPSAKPASGGWPSPAKSDDWGAASRNVAGTGNAAGDGKGKPGLYNKDGSVNLPDSWSKGTNVDLDRAGTWLERPGLEYRGTRFDKYWIPQGTLLEEWVRRGIKAISIPIPGTKLKLQCMVSLLQLGGGCIPVNPDANEQSATGRKAPEIPFKPELQEDNGSVRPAPPPASENP